MRPIDADAALKALRKCQTYLYDARDPELKIELSSAEAAINNLPTIQPEKEQLSQEGTTKDAISRRAALDAVEKNACNTQRIMDAVNNLPPAQPGPTGINAKEAVYNLAEKIGIHQLFALTVELRGEPIQPEPHEGHWIKHETPDGGEHYECSLCGVLWEFTDGTPEDNEAYYCPKCGAKMKGERQK